MKFRPLHDRVVVTRIDARLRPQAESSFRIQPKRSLRRER